MAANEYVAVKFEKQNVPKKVLHLEGLFAWLKFLMSFHLASILSLLKNLPHFAQYICFGQYLNYKILIMQLLGPNIQTLMHCV
jgi:hypothetical protein